MTTTGKTTEGAKMGTTGRLSIGRKVSLDGTTYTIRAVKPNRFSGDVCVHIVDSEGGRLVVDPSEIPETCDTLLPSITPTDFVCTKDRGHAGRCNFARASEGK